MGEAQSPEEPGPVRVEEGVGSLRTSQALGSPRQDVIPLL